ncbi:MAG TPA: Ig-like domain-containing protein, partial [Longimicrobiales bacterium]|nr:Ig-like domain-containing protein [Longimicrobiales bacterium]
MVNSIRRSHVRGVGLPACLVALAVLSGCGGSDGGTEPETPRPTTVVVTPATVTLTYIGATTTLTARILDQNGAPLTGSVTWASDDSGVATVNAGGTITALTNGATVVRATSGALSGTAAV